MNALPGGPAAELPRGVGGIAMLGLPRPLGGISFQRVGPGRFARLVIGCHLLNQGYNQGLL